MNDCLLPRAARVDPLRKSLLVACLGSSLVVEYDATAAEPRQVELGRFRVAEGPTGIAMDLGRREAVVWSEHARTLNVLKLAGEDVGEARKLSRSYEWTITRHHPATPAEPVATLPASGAHPLDEKLRLGRRLFHAVRDERISMHGGCAVCHPDGRDDGLTWKTPTGPLQPPMLAGRLADTAPFGWDGKPATIEAHLTRTFQRIQGTGLEGDERDALVAWLRAMKGPVRHERPLTAEEERGKSLFHDTKVGCMACHQRTGTVDGKSHDATGKGPAFDTPSLRFVTASAPYFHDGRFSSLDELLVKTAGTMGQPDPLAEADRRALVAYLETL